MDFGFKVFNILSMLAHFFLFPVAKFPSNIMMYCYPYYPLYYITIKILLKRKLFLCPVTLVCFNFTLFSFFWIFFTFNSFEKYGAGRHYQFQYPILLDTSGRDGHVIQAGQFKIGSGGKESSCNAGDLGLIPG